MYPEQSVTHNGQRCWNWFRTGHQFRAQGEPAILAGIVRRVMQETARWRIDPERVYVTGISAGGAMAVVLAATYPELFAAVGVHSAPPYRSAAGPANALAAMQGRAVPPPVEATATGAMPPMIIFQGTLDGTVRSVNARRVADQWLACPRHDAGPPTERAGGPADRRPQGGDDRSGPSDIGPEPPRLHRQPVVLRRPEGAGTVGGRRTRSRLVRRFDQRVPTATPGARGPAPRCGKFFAAHRAVEAARPARAG